MGITLGEELGLDPQDPAGKAKHAQLVLDADDMFSELCKGKDKERFDKWFAYIEKVLAKSTSGYLVGSKVTPADFFLYWTMEWIKKRTQDSESPPFSNPADFQKLSGWLSKMDSEPAVQRLEGKGAVRIPDFKVWK